MGKRKVLSKSCEPGEARWCPNKGMACIRAVSQAVSQKGYGMHQRARRCPNKGMACIRAVSREPGGVPTWVWHASEPWARQCPNKGMACIRAVSKTVSQQRYGMHQSREPGGVPTVGQAVSQQRYGMHQSRGPGGVPTRVWHASEP